MRKPGDWAGSAARACECTPAPVAHCGPTPAPVSDETLLLGGLWLELWRGLRLGLRGGLWLGLWLGRGDSHQAEGACGQQKVHK